MRILKTINKDQLAKRWFISYLITIITFASFIIFCTGYEDIIGALMFGILPSFFIFMLGGMGAFAMIMDPASWETRKGSIWKAKRLFRGATRVATVISLLILIISVAWWGIARINI